jgi:rhomboid protease GluP
MDIATFLTITMLALSALQIVVVVLHRAAQSWSWALVNLIVLVVGGVALVVIPAWSPLVVATIFLPFVLAPAILSHIAQRRANMSRPEAAARYGAWAAALHPSTHARFLARVYEALARSDTERCIAALEEMARSVSPNQRTVLETLIAVRRNDWRSALELTTRTMTGDKSITAIRLRALGETEQLEELALTFRDHKGDLVGYDLHFAQLFLLAFTGRVESTNRLLDSALSMLHEDTKHYWRGVAESRATDGTPRSTATLERLRIDAEPASMRMASERHLANPLSRETLDLSQEAWHEIRSLENRVAIEAPRAHFRLADIRATLGLMALLSVVFTLEIWFGSPEDMRTLVRLGALWPPYVTERGEWWRLFTSMLLHAGWLHFAANMFVLFVLGRLVEVSLGWHRTLVGFFAGGLISSATVLAAMELGFTEQAVLIGASGGIFALFGMEVATQLANWRRTRDILDRRRVMLLAIVMLMQLAIDISMPEISLTAHLSGFTAGVVFGTLFAAFHRPPIR